MYAKGATASGSCDPTTDVQGTKFDGNRIYRNGAVVAGYGGSEMWTNCDIALERSGEHLAHSTRVF